MMTPERRREYAETDGLAELFHAAVESRRSTPDLMRVILSGALPLAGADVALVCGTDGSLLAYASSDGDGEESARLLAIEAAQVEERENVDEDRYVARLTASAPYVFAMRWARGRSSHHDVARAASGAVARLLLRTEEVTEPVRDGVIDPLTELPSRTATLRHLDNVLAAAQRVGGRVGVLFIDLDGFKAINDTFGHAVGDQTLIEAARRMQESVRRNDFVGRLGGDEFVAVLTVVDDELEMVEAAQRFLERVLVEVQEGGFTSLVRASIGIAVSPDDGTTPELLLQHADEALYAAKESGGNSVRWYRDGVSQEMRARREFRERLRDASFESDFMLCYQPIVSTSSMRVVGAEALVRWRHPSRGWLTPRTFLDFKGGTMASSALDVKVIRAVAETLNANERLDARIHINIANANSVVWSEMENLIRDVEEAPSRLALEVREATMLADSDAGGSFLRHARRLGIPIGLDGFGSAPTSLSAMASLPLDFIKVDRRVTNPGEDGNGHWKRVARAAIGVAQTLQIRTIADGVEDPEQAKWLVQNGVEQMQGYLIAQPMTAPDFADWMRSSRAGARSAW
ncbi:MAG: diguanylate cyclase [Candidatus Eremiobacteraeota bacterium]|nr:diguanylate cyclase [Candidatus Eremiobacteraeota bacterium]